MSYIFIGFGGVFGAVSRYALGKWISQKWRGSFPAGTFFINLTGAFALGILATLLIKFLPASKELKLFFTTGFIGAYTTFSTFTYETLILVENGEYIQATKYTLLSTLLGIMLCFVAVIIGEHL